MVAVFMTAPFRAAILASQACVRREGRPEVLEPPKPLRADHGSFATSTNQAECLEQAVLTKGIRKSGIL